MTGGTVTGGHTVNNDDSLPRYAYSNDGTVFTAAANAGYFFKGWYDESGHMVHSGAELDVSYVTEDVIVYPEFDLLYNYRVMTNYQEGSINIGGQTVEPGYLTQTGNGAFSGNRNDYTAGTIPAPNAPGYTTIYNNTYPHANNGFQFAYWIKDDGTAPTVLRSDGSHLRGSGGRDGKNLLDRDSTYVAFFVPENDYLIRLNAPAEGGSPGALYTRNPRVVNDGPDNSPPLFSYY